MGVTVPPRACSRPKARASFFISQGDFIVGRIGGSNGTAAFAIHIDGNGVVTVAQYLSIKHDDINDHDENNDNGQNSGDDQAVNEIPNPIQQTLEGKINAVLTVTDYDGDSSTDKIGIGGKIIFEDDGPKLKDLELKHNADVTHDETPGNQNNDITGPLSVFSGVANPGIDPHATAQLAMRKALARSFNSRRCSAPMARRSAAVSTMS